MTDASLFTTPGGIRSAPFYWVVCGDCGIKSTEGTDHAAWVSASIAMLMAELSYWRMHAGVWYCETCEHRHDPEREGEDDDD